MDNMKSFMLDWLKYNHPKAYPTSKNKRWYFRKNKDFGLMLWFNEDMDNGETTTGVLYEKKIRREIIGYDAPCHSY